MVTTMPELLTIDEAAQLLRSSPSQVKHLIADEGLPYVDGLAKGRLILDEALWKWVRSRQKTADESRAE